jgi:uncharacterized protein YjhX (UPF0386 family)
VRVQIRLELGVLELAATGRPDGQRPQGFESLLDFHLDRARRELQEGSDEPFELDHEECADLQRESMQYYHRRIGLLTLGDYSAAADDAEHNLAVMDLLRERAADRQDWLSSEQYRPFVMGQWVRARAMHQLAQGNRRAALRAVEEGIEAIEALFRDDYQRPDLANESEDLRALADLRDTLAERGVPTSGVRRESDLERVQRELASAVEREEYERAAQLRDELARLRPHA